MRNIEPVHQLSKSEHPNPSEIAFSTRGILYFVNGVCFTTEHIHKLYNEIVLIHELSKLDILVSSIK